MIKIRDTRYPPSPSLPQRQAGLRRAGQRPDANRGFTLIELVMTLVVMGVVAGISVPLGFRLFDSLEDTVYRKNLSESVDVILRRMTREVRRLKNDRAVVTANSTTYRFMDLDDATVQFQHNGTDLQREYNGQLDILATNVLTLNFTYLDDQENVITTPLVGDQPTDIKFIQIDLTLESENNTVEDRARVRPVNVIHLSDLFS